MSSNESESPSHQRLARGWPLVSRLFGLPAVLFSAAFVPGVNALVFSGHGGPGWLLLPFCFPVLVWQLRNHVYRAKHPVLAIMIGLGYLLVAYPIASVAQQCITEESGLPIEDRMFYRVATLPIGVVIPHSASVHQPVPPN